MVTSGNGNITKQPITEKKNNSANLTIIDHKIKITYSCEEYQHAKAYSKILDASRLLKALAMVSTTTIKNLQGNEKLEWNLMLIKKSNFCKLRKYTTLRKGLQCGSF